MYNIDFYETADGFSDVKEFLDSLRIKASTVKDARIQFGQAARYRREILKAKSEMKDYISRKERNQ